MGEIQTLYFNKMFLKEQTIWKNKYKKQKFLPY